MLQKRFEKVVLDNYPDALDTRDTSIRYLGLIQVKYSLSFLL